ncbi:protein TOPLESS-like [Eucalyptus grandis]|uniref:protein TOPLESS-like n=1 Tax=Eucalyptus grandis TaxID=71139 RepID=UPI00192EB066|nr:protein TOPLESS-like [Eucalyptus grandis]
MVLPDTPGMPHLGAHLILIILQFLKERGYKEAAHELERESGAYFDWDYMEELILEGRLEEAEKYLSGFTQLEDNRFSMKIYFELRKQKYLEALDSNDVPKAMNILRSDLKVFKANKELFEELTELVALDNIRKNNKLALYSTEDARSAIRWEIKKDIELNPALQGKLILPGFEPCRLGYIINQSLNWQHSHCTYPVPNPVIHTILADHCCQPPKSPVVPPADDALAVTSTDAHPALSQQPASEVLDDLPMKVIQTLKEELYPTDIDFSPIQQTYLLVGTGNGDIGIWEVGSGVKLFSDNFKVWNMEACSTKFKEAMIGDSSISITRVNWSPDGLLFGAAYSTHLVQIYVFGCGNNVKPQLEIEAHDGRVNDLAFSATNKRQSLITCGNDRTVKVWDVMDGVKRFTFEGHNAPVYSIRPQMKSGIEFIFSTSVDGKIRAWLYDDFGARFNHNAPGRACMVMAYSNDNRRLFSCGSNNDGESFLVEWDESEGSVKRTYQGLGKCSLDIAHFHTAKSLLAAGDDHMIKFWNMDNVKLLATTDAEGSLPARPRIRFNKEGSLLAVIADGNTIKILGPNKASQLLKTSKSGSLIAASVASESPMMRHIELSLHNFVRIANFASPPSVSLSQAAISKSVYERATKRSLFSREKLIDASITVFFPPSSFSLIRITPPSPSALAHVLHQTSSYREPSCTFALLAAVVDPPSTSTISHCPPFSLSLYNSYFRQRGLGLRCAATATSGCGGHDLKPEAMLPQISGRMALT